MMSATEQIEARKQAEETKPQAQPQPTAEQITPQTSAKPAAATSSRDSNSVTLILDPHVYAHFAEKAKADDRTISKYIARHLRTFVDEVKGKEKF